MKIKTIDLNTAVTGGIATQIMYEIAAARVCGTELMRINIAKDQSEATNKKLFSVVLKTLKALKAERKIQFYAFDSAFAEGSMEVSFLLNKYPTLFDPMPTPSEICRFVYIKI